MIIFANELYQRINQQFFEKAKNNANASTKGMHKIALITLWPYQRFSISQIFSLF